MSRDHHQLLGLGRRPGIPSRADHAPSCMCRSAGQRARPRSAGPASTPRPPAYSRARRMSGASCTPVPSSVKSPTPSAAISAMGASGSPSRPTVMAPAAARRTSRRLRPSGLHLAHRGRRCRSPATCWAWPPPWVYPVQGGGRATRSRPSRPPRPGLPQRGGRSHQPRCHHTPTAIDDGVAPRELRARRPRLTLGDAHVGEATPWRSTTVAAVDPNVTTNSSTGVHRAQTPDGREVGTAPPREHATPLVTCLGTTARGRAATSADLHPLVHGPGCMISVVLRRAASSARAGVSP